MKLHPHPYHMNRTHNSASRHTNQTSVKKHPSNPKRTNRAYIPKVCANMFQIVCPLPSILRAPWWWQTNILAEIIALVDIYIEFWVKNIGK
jgi:hypothetical protein